MEKFEEYWEREGKHTAMGKRLTAAQDVAAKYKPVVIV